MFITKLVWFFYRDREGSLELHLVALFDPQEALDSSSDMEGDDVDGGTPV